MAPEAHELSIEAGLIDTNPWSEQAHEFDTATREFVYLTYLFLFQELSVDTDWRLLYKSTR